MLASVKYVVADTDLLIRSTSSLLNLVGRQVIQSERYDEDHESPVRQLDRLALLFVTDGPKDVAAVAATVTANDIIVDVAPAIDSTTKLETPRAETVYMAKNSKRDLPVIKSSDKNVSATEKSGRAIPCDDWMEECLNGGPLAPEDHVAQLQYLINKLYQHRDKETFSETYDDVRRYVYYQCLPKIKQRLHLSIAQGYKSTFVDIITNDRALSSKKVRARFLPPVETPPDKLQSHDETSLRDNISEVLDDEVSLKPASSVNPRGINHVVLEGRSMELLFIYFGEALGAAVTHTKTIQGLRRRIGQKTTKEKQQIKEQLATELDMLIEYMIALSELAHQSPSFWHLLGNDEVKNVFRKHWSNPRKTIIEEDDAGDLDLTVGEGDLGDVDESGDEGDDREGNCEPSPGDDPRKAILHWLKCLCQWNTTLSDMQSSTFGKFLISRPLKIHMMQPSYLPHPSEQASLEATLNGILQYRSSPYKLLEAQETLKQLALTKIPSTKPVEPADQEKSANRIALMEKWKILASDDQSQWHTMFTGRIHCESIIAWEMANGSPIQRCSKNIGVSKRCCYTCHILLEKLGPGLKHAATHGKVYPWALPSPDLPDEVKSHVLEKLQEKLFDALEKAKNRVGWPSGDSGSGSSSPERKDRKLVKHKPKAKARIRTERVDP